MLAKIRDRVATTQLGEKGASSVEYLIVVGLIAFAVYAAFSAFGTTVAGKVSDASGKVGQMQIN